MIPTKWNLNVLNFNSICHRSRYSSSTLSSDTSAGRFVTTITYPAVSSVRRSTRGLPWRRASARTAGERARPPAGSCVLPPADREGPRSFRPGPARGTPRRALPALFAARPAGRTVPVQIFQRQVAPAAADRKVRRCEQRTPSLCVCRTFVPRPRFHRLETENAADSHRRAGSRSRPLSSGCFAGPSPDGFADRCCRCRDMMDVASISRMSALRLIGPADL